MSFALSLLILSQAAPALPPTLPPAEIVRTQVVQPLPGHLDAVPTFNSNSPELVGTEGILLSTFPGDGQADPSAHLNFPFSGRFDVFAHHIFRAESPDDAAPLYLGIILQNPGQQTVTVDVLEAASYLSQPDAPFISLPAYVDNASGEVYSGPGSRAMSDVLRGRRQAEFPAQIVIPPGEYRMLMNLPIPVEGLDPLVNGRSSLIRLRSDGVVYAASLALRSRPTPDGGDRPPTLEEWQSLLQTGTLSQPRDRVPTPPDQAPELPIIYGRVAGVSQGARWQARLTDGADSAELTIPAPGAVISYGLSTLVGGRLGTGQVQTAPMLVRYSDTAYQAHGNYSVEYRLTLPLVNPTAQPQRVAIALETPIKEDILSQNGLRFFDPLPSQTFFRGTVRVRYCDAQNRPRTRYVHVVQRRGQAGEPLAIVPLEPGDRCPVEFSFLYPPDATAPQVLTIRTLEEQE